MEPFSLFISYDVIFVTLTVVACLIYLAIKKQLAKNYTLFLLLFSVCYFDFFYLFSFRQPGDSKGLFVLFLLPTFTLFHWLIPFKKDKRVSRVLAIFSAILIAVIVLLYVSHAFSNM